MQDKKLEQALEIYFQNIPAGESEEFREAQKYLKLRIRSAMELLIEKEDTESLKTNSWFLSDTLRRKRNSALWYGFFI